MKVATVNKTLAEFANEDLRHDYENDDMTLKEMELKYDMTRQSIHNRAKKFGWKKLSKIKKITQATVNNFIEIDRLHDSVPALETMSPDVVKHKLSKALQIINDLQDVQNTALYVNKFIINKLVFDLENKRLFIKNLPKFRRIYKLIKQKQKTNHLLLILSHHEFNYT
jgi:predicted DNA-binding protein YlxM (UPF0122 family)